MPVPDVISSFQQYLNNAVSSVKGTVSQVADAVSDPKNLPAFAMTFLLPAILFFVLSPGLLLNLPPNTKARCERQVPLPTTATGKCDYVTGTYTVGASEGTGITAVTMLPICKKRKDCHKVFLSGYTSWGAILLHAFVFLLLLSVIQRMYSGYSGYSAL
jgi:hypothetical protein